MSDRLEQDLEELLARRAASTEAELAAQRAAIADLPSRRRRPPVLAWAAAIVIVVGLAGFAAWRLAPSVAAPVVYPSPSAEATAPAHATAAASPSPSPAFVAAGTPPAWIGTMVGMLQCKWPVAPFGEAVGDGPIGGEVMDTPDDALAAFLAGDARAYAPIPLSGYTRLDNAPRWTLYGSLNDGRRVALIVIEHTPEGWVPYQLAACDAADFEYPVPPGTTTTGWVDGTGSPVPAATLDEVADCYDGTLLTLDGRLYVRDLRGGAYEPTRLLGRFDADASLPADAVDTGYSQGHRQLFLAPDDRYVYVVSPLRVERWPRVTGDEYGRGDCN